MSILDQDMNERIDYNIAVQKFDEADQFLRECIGKYRWGVRTVFDDGTPYDLRLYSELKSQIISIFKKYGDAKSKLGNQGKKLMQQQSTIRTLQNQVARAQVEIDQLKKFLTIACKDAYGKEPNMGVIDAYCSIIPHSLEEPVSVPLTDDNYVQINISKMYEHTGFGGKD